MKKTLHFYKEILDFQELFLTPAIETELDPKRKDVTIIDVTYNIICDVSDHDVRKKRIIVILPKENKMILFT